jgi:nucleotide-binding universal stress UspA family protein
VIVPQFADMPVAGIPDVIAIERESEQKLLSGLAIAIEEKLGRKPSIDILYGETAELVAETCKRYNADEAIVPSHARHGFSRFWFGSVAEDIVDAAPCTVVVLKMHEAQKR